MKRKTVKKQKRTVGFASRQVSPDKDEIKKYKGIASEMRAEVHKKGDGKDPCGRGGCCHPRSIHITGECHQMKCVCAGFIETV